MARVCCPVSPSPFYLHHQPVGPQQFDKGIKPGHASCLIKQLLDDQIQFGASKSGIVPAVVPGLLDYQRFKCVFGKGPVILAVVIGLSAVTKQLADSLQRSFRLRLLAKQTYCLVPDFFLIGMLKVSSARLIIVSYACARSLSISASFRAFFYAAFSSLIWSSLLFLAISSSVWSCKDNTSFELTYLPI